jgi:hypothetical protein
MPSELLSCQHCGSGDVQEVKPETYFCNHCEEVFRYVRPNPARATGGCEVRTAGRPCRLLAIGRCNTCSKVYCATHQAHNLNSIGIVIQTYRDWCVACQEQRKIDERALAEAKDKSDKEERAAAARRIPGLIARFTAQPFKGAMSRDYVERISVGTKFLSASIKYKSVVHEYEPAVPVARLYWNYYKVSYDASYDEPKQASDKWDTGLTQAGKFVPMDTSYLHTWVAVERGYDLAGWQEVKICKYLERLLRRPRA